MTIHGICPICNKEYMNLIIHISKKKDSIHTKYVDELNSEVDKLIKETNLYISEIREKLSNKYSFLTNYYIDGRIKIVAPGRGYQALSERRKGINNPVHNEGVSDKIRETIKEKWSLGYYKDRVNGMLGVLGKDHPNYKEELHTNSEECKRNYRKFLSEFEDINKCVRCGSDENPTNIHHIDEDHNNFLLSNLTSLCVPCHSKFHYQLYKEPFISICKIMRFAACHRLPDYIGGCENFHGHEWILEVSIKKRVDPLTHMVMDFKDLKNAMKEYIIDVLDHSTLNDIIEMPTAENILIWCWEQLMFNGIKGIDKIKLWEAHDSYSELTKEGMLSIFVEKINKGIVQI